MITIQTIIIILFTHWLFDFFLQSEKIGKFKSTSNLVLSTHVGIYSIGLFLLSAIIFKHGVEWVTVGLSWVVINAAAHFLTDYVTSRATSALYKEQRYHEFFTIIGLDQFIHYITLFGTYVWLKN